MPRSMSATRFCTQSCAACGTFIAIDEIASTARRACSTFGPDTYSLLQSAQAARAHHLPQFKHDALHVLLRCNESEDFDFHIHDVMRIVVVHKEMLEIAKPHVRSQLHKHRDMLQYSVHHFGAVARLDQVEQGTFHARVDLISKRRIVSRVVKEHSNHTERYTAIGVPQLFLKQILTRSANKSEKKAKKTQTNAPISSCSFGSNFNRISTTRASIHSLKSRSRARRLFTRSRSTTSISKSSKACNADCTTLGSRSRMKLRSSMSH
jgi:hypothetical protein